MDAAQVLAAIALAARLVELAIKVGADAMPFVKKIQQWATGNVQPTQEDFDELARMEQPFLDMLNDTSHDDSE